MEKPEEKKEERKCIRCGDTITEENKSFSILVCNKYQCKRYAELMDL